MAMSMCDLSIVVEAPAIVPSPAPTPSSVQTPSSSPLAPPSSPPPTPSPAPPANQNDAPAIVPSSVQTPSSSPLAPPSSPPPTPPPAPPAPLAPTPQPSWCLSFSTFAEILAVAFGAGLFVVGLVALDGTARAAGVTVFFVITILMCILALALQN